MAKTNDQIIDGEVISIVTTSSDQTSAPAIDDPAARMGGLLQQVKTNWLNNITSARTRSTYEDAIKAFESFVNKPLWDAGQTDVINYRNHLETTTYTVGKTTRNYSAATINLHLADIGSFFRYAADQVGLKIENPSKGVKRQKINAYGKATFLNGKQGEDNQFLDAIDATTLQGKRDYAIMLIFLTTGVRVSAVAGLRMGDLKRHGVILYMHYSNKGGETEKEKLTAPVIDALTDYLTARYGRLINAADLVKMEATAPVFTATPAGKLAIQATGNGGDREQPLTARTIRNLVTKYGNIAFGKGHGIHPHSLRHTVAINAELSGQTTNAISKKLRHKSRRITDLYLDHVTDDNDADNVTDTLSQRYERRPKQQMMNLED